MTGSERIYLDHNASTPLAAVASGAISAALAKVGANPSSIHAEGRATRDLLEAARRQVARLAGGAADELMFASSGTEAVALGVVGLARSAAKSGSPRRVLLGASEHPSVSGAADALAREGFAVSWLKVNRWGQIDLDAARAATAGGVAVVAASLANHEVGTLQPIAELAQLSADVNAALFCDAVQSAGKQALDPRALGIDAMALSAHKFGGPQGVGVLWLSPQKPIEAIISGGHQERERRPGTENVLGIVGTGAAGSFAAEHIAETDARNRDLTGHLEVGLGALGCDVVGAGAARVGNTTCFRRPGAPAEVVVQALDLAGFAVSAGAACTSGRVEPSPVLLAMGYGEREASEAIRVSVGAGNNIAEIDALLAALAELLPRVCRFS